MCLPISALRKYSNRMEANPSLEVADTEQDPAPPIEDDPDFGPPDPETWISRALARFYDPWYSGKRFGD